LKHGNIFPVIGVLMSDVEGSYQGCFFEELRSQSAALGFRLVVYSGTVIGTPTWFERQMNMAYHLAHSRQLDGVISVTSTFMRAGTEATVQRLLDQFKPLPRVSMTGALSGIPSVLIDNIGGFKHMLEHLVRDHAYRDFAFLSGPAGSPDAQHRLKTFRTVMVESAIRVDPRLIQDGEFNYHGGRKATERILASGLPVRVIVAASDEMAMAAIAVAAEHGLRIPEDLAIVGVDDLHQHVKGLRLTTVNNALPQQVAAGLSALRTQMAGEEAAAVSTIASRLVRRQSCGCSVEINPKLPADCGWAEREAQLLEGLALDGQNRARFEQYLMQCLDALASEEPRALERVVWRIANDCLALDDEIVGLQSLLLGIQTLLLDPEALSAHDMWRLGCQLNQAQMVVVKAKTMNSVARGERLGLTEGSINFLKRKLLSFEVHQQMENLPEVLGEFGIKTCIIAFYEEQGYFNTSNDYFLPAKARLVACLIDGERHNDQLWRTFDTEALMPDEVWTLTGNQSLIVMPAFQQAGHYGYMLFGPEQPLGMSLESVREGIASSLIGSLLVEEVGRVRDYLAKDPKRLARTSSSIEQMSTHDHLSGLLNRQGFVDEASDRLASQPLSRHLLVHASMNGLASIEEQTGKSDLDFAIEQASRVFAGMLRSSDLVARVSNDRFIALCSDVEPSFICDLRTRLAKAFEQFNNESSKHYQITCNLVFQSIPAGSDTMLEAWLDQPDN